MSDLIVGVTECVENLNLAPDAIIKAVRRGIKQGLKTHQKKAKELLQANVDGATRKNPKYTDTLMDAIIARVKQGYYFGEVDGVLHTMGTHKKGSGTYRTRFFEKGTKDRYQKKINGKTLKKPRYIGKIDKRNFFAPAAQGVNETVSAAVRNEVEKVLANIDK